MSCVTVLAFFFVDCAPHGMTPQSFGATEWQAKVLDEIPSHLSRRYSWSFCKSAKLPQGTVFLKRKKQFTKGRAIISYSGSLCSKLLELASVALTLTLIVKTLYADSPGLLSMPQLWQAIHTHWSSSRSGDEADLEWSDDLVGFFNAVPRADILKAVHCIVQEYSQQTGHTVLAIDLLSKSGHPGQPRGKTKSSLKRLWIQDLPSIVDLSAQLRRLKELYVQAGFPVNALR